MHIFDHAERPGTVCVWNITHVYRPLVRANHFSQGATSAEEHLSPINSEYVDASDAASLRSILIVVYVHKQFNLRSILIVVYVHKQFNLRSILIVVYVHKQFNLRSILIVVYVHKQFNQTLVSTLLKPINPFTQREQQRKMGRFDL